jgi:hypothetical protein
MRMVDPLSDLPSMTPTPGDAVSAMIGIWWRSVALIRSLACGYDATMEYITVFPEPIKPPG